MATLAEINQTLQMQVELMVQQGKSVEKTSKDIASLKDKIAQSLIQQKADRLDNIETKREAKSKKDKISAMPSGFLAGLSKGTGVSWLGDLIGGVFGSLLGKGGSLVGMLTGAIGLAAGKLLVWGAIGTLIATFFGDELKAVAEKFKEYTGIDLVKMLDENPAISIAITALAGNLTLGVTKALARLGARAVGGLAGIGMGMLGFGGKDAAKTPKSSTGGRTRTPTGSSAKAPTLLDKNGRPLRGTALTARQNAIARSAQNSGISSKMLGYMGKAAPAAKALVKKIPLIGNAVSAGFGYFDEDYEKAGYGGLDRAALGIGQGFAELGDLATYLGAGTSNYLFGTELGSTDLAGAYKRAVTSDVGSALLQGRLGDAYDAMAAPTGDINAKAFVAPNRMAAFNAARASAVPSTTGNELTASSTTTSPTVIINNITNNTSSGGGGGAAPSIIMPPVPTNDRLSRGDRLGY